MRIAIGGWSASNAVAGSRLSAGSSADYAALRTRTVLMAEGPRRGLAPHISPPGLARSSRVSVESTVRQPRGAGFCIEHALTDAGGERRQDHERRHIAASLRPTRDRIATGSRTGLDTDPSIGLRGTERGGRPPLPALPRSATGRADRPATRIRIVRIATAAARTRDRAEADAQTQSEREARKHQLGTRLPDHRSLQRGEAAEAVLAPVARDADGECRRAWVAAAPSAANAGSPDRRRMRGLIRTASPAPLVRPRCGARAGSRERDQMQWKTPRAPGAPRQDDPGKRRSRHGHASHRQPHRANANRSRTTYRSIPWRTCLRP